MVANFREGATLSGQSITQENPRRPREDDMPPIPPSPQVEQTETERLLALARSKGFAVTADDVRRRFGDEPLTPEAVLQALATAGTASSMEVDASTSDAELEAFLFGD